MSYECKTCGAKLLNRDECARCDHETIEALNEDVARLKAELAASEAGAAALRDLFERHMGEMDACGESTLLIRHDYAALATNAGAAWLEKYRAMAAFEDIAFLNAEERDHALASVAAMKNALEYYADEANHKRLKGGDFYTEVDADGGGIARAALQALKGESRA